MKSAVFAHTRPAPRLVRLCAVNLVVLVMLFLLAEYVAERTWLTTLLAYAPPLMYTPVSLVLFLVALLRRSRVSLLLTGLALIFLTTGFLDLRVPLRHPTASGTRLRLMTWNIAHGTSGTNALASVIREANPDVMCLQETNGIAGSLDPLPALTRALPDYRFVRAGEVAIGSRLAMGDARPCPLLTRAGVYRVALTVPVTPRGASKPVMVTTVHLATAATGESVSNRRTGLPSYLRRTTEARGEQIVRLNEFQSRLTGPALICGDFNTPPRGIMYRRLRDGRTDVWASVGRGLGWTFSSKHPVLRIDHVFSTPDLTPVSCRTVPITASVSDHLPVVADFGVAPAP